MEGARVYVGFSVVTIRMGATIEVMTDTHLTITIINDSQHTEQN